MINHILYTTSDRIGLTELQKKKPKALVWSTVKVFMSPVEKRHQCILPLADA